LSKSGQKEIKYVFSFRYWPLATIGDAENCASHIAAVCHLAEIGQGQFSATRIAENTSKQTYKNVEIQASNWTFGVKESTLSLYI